MDLPQPDSLESRQRIKPKRTSAEKLPVSGIICLIQAPKECRRYHFLLVFAKIPVPGKKGGFGYFFR